jgi:cell filamentation protein
VRKKGGRYDVSDLPEAQHEPGSRRQVLRNRLGIKSGREMGRVETTALAVATNAFIRTYDQDHSFSAQDICNLHRVWLGEIYEWAGEYRRVNVGKGGFQFAAADLIPDLMRKFEQQQLSQYTPCHAGGALDVAHALAETHVELMLIHPFREGNGRVGRTLSTLMALQAGLPLLDFSLIRGRKKQEYFAAVRAGIDRNYEPMKKIFSEIIEKSFPAS